MSEIIVGEIGEDGSPYVDIILYGPYNDKPGLPLKGLVDTGFTGFLQINFLEACKINLPLQGIGSAHLADGSVVKETGNRLCESDRRPRSNDRHWHRALV